MLHNVASKNLKQLALTYFLHYLNDLSGVKEITTLDKSNRKANLFEKTTKQTKSLQADC